MCVHVSHIYSSPFFLFTLYFFLSRNNKMPVFLPLPTTPHLPFFFCQRLLSAEQLRFIFTFFCFAASFSPSCDQKILGLFSPFFLNNIVISWGR